ncbi:unnamed protein product [Rhizoctonia solani]|uniref:Uncharacterized protein n=1 Tax=Rhizoctonia solani TaxID=456999 RepID=A0A8H3H5A2_9AGAM|nr:unnamed protein product [Rhizoctonia solani]
MAADLDYSTFVIWQYWMTILRLLSALAGFIFFLVIIPMSLVGYWITQTALVELCFMAVVWLLVITNDIYMLTIDMNKGYTYIGCIGTQSLISIISLTMNAIGASGTPDLGYQTQPVNALCLPWSFGLLLLLISTTISLRVRYRANWVVIWKTNTKDAFLSTIKCSQATSGFLSLMGRPRDITILHRRIMSISGHGISKSLSRALFRRVSPVETRGYALARNGFALLAMGILVFRTITVLIWTQNKLSTRISYRGCRNGPHIQNIQVLVFVSAGSQGSAQNITVEVRKQSDKVIDSCRQEVPYTHSPPLTRFGWLLYTCNSSGADDWGYVNGPHIYHIEVRSADESDLNLNDMPRIWLTDKRNDVDDKFNGAISPSYTIPWRLTPGYHTEAEAGWISRGFIASSIWRDIVLNSDPEYTYLSLYPINELATQPFQNATTATARLHATFKPGLSYLRDKRAFDEFISGDNRFPYFGDDGCDFVEDYRSGSVLDILGSIGGLFAILQTIHVLLFGRPLFWGIMGTKLINPFGLVGSFGSNGFERRLHETYGREPTKDNPECIRTAAFLRDFVLDFGPLQSRLDQSQEQISMRAMPVANKTGTVDSTVPLMLVARRDSAIDSKEESNLDFLPSSLKSHARRNSIV